MANSPLVQIPAKVEETTIVTTVSSEPEQVEYNIYDPEGDVANMMTLFQQDFPIVPTLPDEGTRYLRAKLIFEEALEAVADLGFTVDKKSGNLVATQEGPNLTNLAKELADILVVTYGAAVACGIHIYPVFKAVHDSNMSKLWPGENGPEVKKNEYGKVIKGPDYAPPDIQTVLDKQA